MYMDLRRLNDILRELVLRPLSDIENSVEGIVEGLSEQFGVSRPRVVATAVPTDECGQERPGLCRGIAGRYSDGALVFFYRATLPAILHLFAHHLQAAELGERFRAAMAYEAERLPWELRPLEIAASVRAAQIARSAPPRLWRIWEDEVKPKIKELDENLARLSGEVEPLLRAIAAQARP